MVSVLLDREQKSTLLYYFLVRNKIISTSILRLYDYPGVLKKDTRTSISLWRFIEPLGKKIQAK